MGQHLPETPRVLLSTEKRNVLVGKICLFCFLLAVLHIILDASQRLYESVAMDVLFALIIGLAYLLNHWKHHRASKIFVLFSLNILFIFFASVLPRQIGIYLYYFPLMVASSALFDADEKWFRYFFVALPALMLSLLIVFDFDFPQQFEFLPPVHLDAFFAVNAFSTAAVTILLVNFMQKLNSHSERELKELAEEVKGKNSHLEKTNAELDRFLYSTSHDLRSPLSSIKGLVNIARLESTEEKIQRYFTMMIDRVDKLDFFIKDIIDYSKNARTEVRSEPVDFTALLEEVTDNLRYIEGGEAIQFKSHVALDRPVDTDKNRLTVVLNNLMANAIKYHDPRKEEQWIKVSVSHSGGDVNIIVSDNGSGIDPEHHAKIFDMFYRGTFHSKGSGLGLYIVKETINKMNGSIRVESAPRKGSSFFVTLPIPDPVLSVGAHAQGGYKRN